MHSTFDIPFTFSPRGSAGIDPTLLEPLSYEIIDHGQIQRQFHGRKLIRPCIDLDAYKFEALIDWIELGIRTATSTNFATVQRQLEGVLGYKPWVKSVGGASHHADTRFRARIQDPTRHQLLAIEPALAGAFDLAAPIRVTGLEVAVDVRPKNGALRDRLAMVVLLQRHLLVHRPEWTDRLDDARYVYPLSSGGSSKPSRLIQAIQGKAGSGDASDRKIEDVLVRARILREQGHKAPFLDSTLYFGRKGGPAMVSIEHKVSDRRNPAKETRELLADEECRARIEVRLLDEALGELGIREPDDLFGFRFQKLRAPFFMFTLPTVPTFGMGQGRVNELVQAKRLAIFKRSGAYGVDRFEYAEREELRRVAMDENKASRSKGEEADAIVLAMQRAKSGYRQKRFDDLNGKIRTALRGLTRRMDDGKAASCEDHAETFIPRLVA